MRKQDNPQFFPALKGEVSLRGCDEKNITENSKIVLCKDNGEPFTNNEININKQYSIQIDCSNEEIAEQVRKIANSVGTYKAIRIIFTKEPNFE